MQLYSLGFLFLFLPVGGLIYYFLHSNGRRRCLLLYSLLFVALLSPLCLLLLFSLVIVLGLCRLYVAFVIII